MSHILEKAKEVSRTLLPVVIFVIIICFTLIDVETDILIRFFVGSALLLIGLSIFLWGVDLSMNPIGKYMSLEVATAKSPIKIGILSFLLGFLITVAEPDLLILGSQIETASGGVLSAIFIVYVVSIGVGILVAFGIFRLLQDKPLNRFMAFNYSLFAILAIFVSQEFLAMAFDASGATTGALTTPFALALSLGLSNVKGGKHSRENSFGIVGIMSAGPILAVMLMSIITGQKNIQGEVVEYVVSKGVIGPILRIIPSIFVESLMALLPLSILFFIFNFKKFKISKDSLSVIIKGLIASLCGLTLFLTAVHSGFMDMGRIIGLELASLSQWILIGTAFLMGLIVVLVEPAVHVLGKQIEEVTGGSIPLVLIRMTLSIGVGLAIALSMVRIVVPAVQLWFFLLPGFATAVFLSFKADPVFVGIAYDAGGVASGPMTATFVLAFAQGAASVIDSAQVLVDGFGVIAMVAMAPVLSIMILGTAFRHKKVISPVSKKENLFESSMQKEHSMQHVCIMVFINRGFAKKVVDYARQFGATGATIFHGRGSDADSHVVLPVLHFEIQPEKEIVLFITSSGKTKSIADGLLSNEELIFNAEIEIFVSPSEAMIETLTAEKQF